MHTKTHACTHAHERRTHSHAIRQPWIRKDGNEFVVWLIYANIIAVQHIRKADP